jgi:zinc transport system substrate-binding protein
MKRILAAFLAFLLIFTLSSCHRESGEENNITVAATTYPVYLFVTAVTDGVEGINVQLIINQPTSCLHDYTLTVRDMKIIEGSDAIIMNGAGLEDFMEDALSSSNAHFLDCSVGLELLSAQPHHHEDHDHEHDDDCSFDPHYWLGAEGPYHALNRITAFLSDLDPSHAKEYETNRSAAAAALDKLAERRAEFSSLSQTELITFHDGFRYLAESCGLTILKSIEEEEGSEASAAELVELVSIIRECGLPAIFTEVNGSQAAARTLTRETGTEAYPLSMIMSGKGHGIQPYINAMNANYDTILAALGG